MQQRIDKYDTELVIAVFIILATIFNILESVIPRPIPWLRIGLGNIFIITGLILFGFKDGLLIGISKSVISSIFLGTLLTPGFFMSLTGTVLSIAVMYILLKYMRKVVSVIGISITGAVFHNLGQFLVILFIMKFHESIIYQIPPVLVLGVITGLIIGLITKIFIKKWEVYISTPPVETQ